MGKVGFWGLGGKVGGLDRGKGVGRIGRMEQDEPHDPFEDDDYDEEKESRIRTIMAPLTVVAEKAASPSGRAGIAQDHRTQEQKADDEDRRSWATALPESHREAQFIGNLGNRLLKGITPKEIRALTVKERVNSAAALFTVRQLLLDKPTSNFSFEERQTVQGVLAKAQRELERRERERQTILVSVNDQEEEGE